MKIKYLNAFHHYLHIYFCERNYPALIKLIDPNTTGFGTGADEEIFSEMGVQALFKRDIEDAPNQINYTILDEEVTLLSKGSAIVMASMDIATTIMAQEIKLSSLRMSVAFADEPSTETPLIRHIHVSFPTAVHEEGEAYPLKELEDRMQVIERILKERTKTLHEAYAELAHMVNTDKLTGVASRTRLDEALESELTRYKRFNSSFAIIFFDIDKFKEINDRMGHDFGDLVLKKTAELTQRLARDTDLVGRWGGDEFMVLLPESTLEQAQVYAQNLKTNLEFNIDFSISASIGIATPNKEDSSESLFKRADQAMYATKKQGSNRNPV